jgi:3-ketosteroid 9alpha-monooxygenase subunit B
MADHDDVRSRHGFHALRVKAVVQETHDTRSFVLDVPADLRDDFRYRPGQYCTFRIHVDDDEHARCYSMSSAPETDDDLTVTVKRVPGGVVSNWLNDHVAEGDVLEVTRPSGSFCVRPGDRPVIGFCGGSGVTPVISIAKSVLASTSRPVTLLYANRDERSVIFDDALRALLDGHDDRMSVHRHLDADAGFVDAATIAGLVDGRLDADFYVCGPGPFMDLVEQTLLGLGVDPAAIAVERFVAPGSAGQAGAPPDGELEPAAATTDTDADIDTDTAAAEHGPESIVVILKGKKHELAYRAGDTVLETARRANLATPYSCEAGSCATCMAFLREGTVRMRVNDALDPDEVEEGWVLTCQSLPTAASLTVEFEPL